MGGCDFQLGGFQGTCPGAKEPTPTIKKRFDVNLKKKIRGNQDPILKEGMCSALNMCLKEEKPIKKIEIEIEDWDSGRLTKLGVCVELEEQQQEKQ